MVTLIHPTPGKIPLPWVLFLPGALQMAAQHPLAEEWKAVSCPSAMPLCLWPVITLKAQKNPLCPILEDQAGVKGEHGKQFLGAKRT